MNDNTILRIKVPASLYESVKEQLTINEAKSKHHYGVGMEVVKEKKMSVPKDGMKKVKQTNKIEEKNTEMEKKHRTLDELKKAKAHLDKKIQEMEGTKSHKSKVEEASTLTDPNFLAGVATLLGVGGGLISALVSDLKKAKTPEEKKAVRQKMADAIKGSMSGNMEEAEGALNEYEDYYYVRDGKCYRKTDEGYVDQVNMFECKKRGIY